jgi:hypothetical protein
VTRGVVKSARRVQIYGAGGIGKSSLAALAPNPIFLDIEDGTNDLAIARVTDIHTWARLRAWLQSDAANEYGSIVIDSTTKAEELATAHTLATIKHPDKGILVDHIESYGFGKGYQFLFETFLPLLVDLDRHVRAGRNVVLVTHDCVNDVPNPVGEDFIRYEPRLQQPKSGKASIRERVFEWCDDVLWIGYDVAVSKEGKGTGTATRTIWGVERPDHRAKTRSRALSEVGFLNYENDQDGAVWPLILGGAK